MAIEKHILSKSTYIRSLQCLKSLYLYKYHYKLRDPVTKEQQLRFDKGHNIGKLAQQLFPDGLDASPDQPYNYYKSVQFTKDLINKGYDTVYEAAFQFEKSLAVIDILVKRSGKWFAYEVKSSPAISETYLRDAAMQYFVITNSGLQLEDFSIIHLNRSLAEAMENNTTEIFTEQSVKEHCLAEKTFVKNKIFEAKQTLQAKILPAIETGEQCSHPYKCDYYGFCHRAEPKEGQLF